MLRISLQTLRARRGTLAGAFIAIWLAVTLAYGTGLLMDGALSPPGPGRFAAAQTVVRAKPADPTLPAPLLAAGLVEGAVDDVAFPVGAWADGRRLGTEPLHAHGWSSAALAPYRLTAGRAPSGPREVVADERLRAGTRVRVAAPGGEATYRVTGTVRAAAGAPTLFFADAVASRLSGHPGKADALAVPSGAPERVRHDVAALVAASTRPAGHRPPSSIVRRHVAPAADSSPSLVARRTTSRCRDRAATSRLEALDRAHAADADAGDPRAADRATLVAIFATMGGIAGAVALFVVAGTFTLAITQRRREVAVLRALGAAPHQVRRLIAGEALIVSVVAGALGILAGRPLADAIVSILAEHGTVPAGFGPGSSWIPLVAAFGGGILVAQVAVFAAARRAGRTRPAEALREAAIERARPGILQLLTGLACLGGGVAMALIFKGTWALAFAILEGLLLAVGVGLLGRALLGLPAALLAYPLRRLGAAGLLAGTSLAANRWRTAALATPIVLVAMLAGIQGVVQDSGRRDTEAVTAERVTAPFVVTGRDGAPVSDDTARRLAGRRGIDGVAAVRTTEIQPDGALGENGPYAAAAVTTHGARTLDLRFSHGSLADVRGDRVAVSRVLAESGDLRPGSRFTAAGRTLHVAAIYERAAGLGDVVTAHADAPTAAVFVAGSRRALDRFAAHREGLTVLTRDEYRAGLRTASNEQAWAVWMIIGLAALFSALALINTAAMATAERRSELATIRLLGGTPGLAARTVALETLPTVLVALGAGAAIVATAVHGVPLGLTGIPLSVPVTLVAAVTAGAAALGLLAALVSTRLALRASPAAAMRL